MDDEAVSRVKSTVEALMSFTMLPLRRTLRDDRRKVGKGRETKADGERKMGSSAHANARYIGTRCAEQLT